MKAPPSSPLKHGVSVCYFGKNGMEIRHERLPTDHQVDAFPSVPHTAGGVWKIVHDGPTEQPTVAELITSQSEVGGH